MDNIDLFKQNKHGEEGHSSAKTASAGLPDVYRRLQQAEEELSALKKRNYELEQTVINLEKDNDSRKQAVEKITEQHKRQDIYYSLIFEYSPDMIIVIDKEYRLTNATRKSLLKYGIDLEYILGRSIYEVFELFAPSDQNELALSVMEEVMNDGVAQSFEKQEIELINKSYVFDLDIVPLKEEETVIGIMMTFHDVTHLHEIIAEAEYASKAKSSFLAKFSHEIRTPMNAVLGLSELVLRCDISKEIREHILGIKRAGNNLVSIINNILDFSKIESGMMEINSLEYSLSSMLNYVISVIRMRVIDHLLLFTAYVDPTISDFLIGDEMRIKQMVINLLTNACKYSEKGFFKLVVNSEKIDDDRVMLNIEVIDSGIGIKQEDIDSLFGDFVQVGGAVAHQGIEGTGLGLAITRGFAVAMGGDISVTSEYGKGSCFKISIPQGIVKDKHDKVFARVDVNGVNEPPISLIYETREVYAESLVQTMNSLGLDCHLATTQSEFVVELARRKYDFIFVSAFFYDGVKRMLRDLGRISGSKLILIAKFGEEVVENETTKTLTMPAHAADIADIFNDCVIGNQNLSQGSAKFIAPEARVLIVDDINTNLMVAQGLMSPYKLTIDTCVSGRESIALVQENDYDIVFMDHMMPEMDGVEATAKIRALPVYEESGRDADYYKNLIIIALTANAVIGMKEMFLKNDFNDFLAKPIDVNLLDSILSRWLPEDKVESFSVDETKEQELLSFKIEGIDVENGIYMTGGSSENYLKTLGVFRNDGLEKLDVLRQCVSMGDMPLYAIHVHALKSASASIGAAKISKLARALETAAKNSDNAFVEANNEKFLEELLMLFESIKFAVSSVNVEKEAVDAEIDYAYVAEQAQNLCNSIAVFDMESVDNIINELRVKVSGDMSKTVDAIANSVLICEFDKANDLAEELIILSRNAGG